MIMKKNWKNRSGVSPVIATILMVAITVVLAAVLYVMVMGFGGSSSAPTAKLSASHVAGATFIEKVEVTSISAATQYADMKVSIVVDGNAVSATVANGTVSASWPTGVSEVKFVDLANDGKVSTGDYFLVTGTEGKAVTMNLLYGSDATSIASDSWTVA